MALPFFDPCRAIAGSTDHGGWDGVGLVKVGDASGGSHAARPRDITDPLVFHGPPTKKTIINMSLSLEIIRVMYRLYIVRML